LSGGWFELGFYRQIIQRRVDFHPDRNIRVDMVSISEYPRKKQQLSLRESGTCITDPVE